MCIVLYKRLSAESKYPKHYWVGFWTKITAWIVRDLEDGNVLVKMPKSPVFEPMSALTAEREKEPVVVYALNMEPARFASPRPIISWVTAIEYLPLLASILAMEIDSIKSTNMMTIAMDSSLPNFVSPRNSGPHKSIEIGGRPAHQCSCWVPMCRLLHPDFF